VASTSEKKSPSLLRVAVVGAGYVSKHHIEALRRLPFVTLVGIADLNHAAARAAAARYSIPLACHSLEELAPARPQVTYLLTPPDTHCSLAVKALQMGSHVFVEKPMAETVEECDRMIECARQQGLILSVNHSDKFDPVVQEALRRVQAGACGDLLAVDIIRSSSYAPYAGGSLPAIYAKGSYPFQDLGVHSLYLLEAFLGPIEQVDIEFRSTGRDPNLLFDEWYVLARCRGGIGRSYISWNVRPMQNRLSIYGTAGVLHVDRFLQLCIGSRNLPGPKFVHLVLSAVRNALYTAWGVPLNVAKFAVGRLPASPGIRAGAAAFARAVYEGAPPPVSAEEGRRMVQLMEPACRRADQIRADRRRAALVARPRVPILVTGATGFLGGALLERLRQRGECVRALARRRPLPEPDDPRIQWVIGDLGDPEVVEQAVAGVETVFHVGATMKGSREHFQAGTVWGTRNVVEACLKSGVRRLVHVSSLSVLDHAGHRPGMHVTESWPLEPHPERRGLYTQTKLQAEQIVLEAVRRRGLPAVILRPGQIFGPGSPSHVPSGAIALAGRWIVCGSGSRPLPLVFVEDVVDALLLAAEADLEPGAVFHVVDSQRITQRQYIEAVCQSSGAGLKVHYIPSFLLLTLGLGLEWAGRLLGRELPLSRYRVRSLRPLSDLDCSAARRVLGWEPRVGVVEGLKITFPPRSSYP